MGVITLSASVLCDNFSSVCKLYVKIPHGWKSHVAAHMYYKNVNIRDEFGFFRCS